MSADSGSTTTSLAAGLASSWRHLRLKNTLHVAPVVLFAISQSPDLDVVRLLLTVVTLHLFIFPASVGYNSYYDKDDKPTGGMDAPPPVHESLYWIATALEVCALALAALTSLHFLAFIVVTIVASRAYSYDKIRVKGYPILGYVWVGFFQGGFSYVMVLVGIAGDPAATLAHTFTWPVLLPALFSSFLVLGSYPLSQVYQFEEDGARGDTTIAMLCGYRGTFILCQAMLTVGYVVVASFFVMRDQLLDLAILTVLFLAPGGYLFHWARLVARDVKHADHDRAMTMAKLAGAAGSVCFLILMALNFAWRGA